MVKPGHLSSYREPQSPRNLKSVLTTSQKELTSKDSAMTSQRNMNLNLKDRL